MQRSRFFSAFTYQRVNGHRWNVKYNNAIIAHIATASEKKFFTIQHKPFRLVGYDYPTLDEAFQVLCRKYPVSPLHESADRLKKITK
jgi:hypothetical protein